MRSIMQTPPPRTQRTGTSRASVLEKLGRNDEAGRAFTRAIQAAQADSQRAHYLHRSRFFQRQGKLAEAAEDACVGRGIPKREPATPAHLLDLSVAYTVPLTSLPMLNPAQPGGCELPVGVHKFGGIDFDVRGVVFFPPSAVNKPISIPVKARCPGLHFLQATYAYSGRYGESSGKYTVRYADQRTEEIKLVIGRNVRDWWCYEGTAVETSEAPLVWVGLTKSTGEGRSPLFPCLYVMSWTNPWPEAEIDSLDFEPPGAPSMVKPFLIALTKAGDGASSASKPERTVFQQTLAILDSALASQPEQLGLVLAKAGLLERHGRGEEALDLVSKAIAVAEAKYGRATNQLSVAVRYRSALLSRLNGPADSQVLSNEAGGLPAKDSHGPASVTNTPGPR